MNAYNKHKNRLEQFLQTTRGKRFINSAYSFGAAIVILGAMFKLLYVPFGNEIFFIGMITECIIFILSAFDTPVRDYKWEQVFPSLSSQNPGDNVQECNAGSTQQAPVMPYKTASAPVIAQNAASNSYSAPANEIPQGLSSHVNEIPQDLSSHTEEYGKQMENLNRTLSGLNAIYEIQLKNVSSQIGAIEQISRGLSRLGTMYGDTLPNGTVIKTETEKMADQLRELNDVYARMLHAMTVNRHDNPGNPNP